MTTVAEISKVVLTGLNSAVYTGEHENHIYGNAPPVIKKVCVCAGWGEEFRQIKENRFSSRGKPSKRRMVPA